VPRPVQPLLCIRTGIQNADWGHRLLQYALERAKARRVWIAPQTLQDRFPFVDLQILILRISFIGFAGRFLKAALQRGDKGFRLRGDAGAFSIGFETLTAFLFAHELLSEIAVTIAAGDTKIAGLQLAHHLREDANFKPAARNLCRFLLGRRIHHHKGPPKLTNKREIESQRLIVFAGTIISNR
jgi:hypothetical protein